MTTGSVSQVGVEVLFRAQPGMRVSQSGAEYLHTVFPGVKVSQAGAEYLHRVLPGLSISQAGAEILYKSMPCGTRLAQIWTIVRPDGLTFRFTSLDRELEWPPRSGTIYGALHSLAPSASEGVSQVDEMGSMDLSGSLATITEHALFTGLFDGAEAEAWLVPWSGQGPTRRLLKGTFGSTKQGQTSFTVEILGAGARLQQTSMVRTLQPGCWKKFGDQFCQKDLGPLTVTGTVDSAIGQREFVDAARAEPTGYFTDGEVTFTTGDNAGKSAEIKEHSTGGRFVLWPRLPFGASAGDQYAMTPGCTLLKESANGTNGCDDWANYVNFGGARDVPTKDRLTASAVVKESS